MRINNVSLNNIDLSSDNHDRYLFNYGRDSNALTDSIRKVGLINPVILHENRGSDRVYTVVCGYQRIMACKRLGWKSIEAKVIDGFNDEEILLLTVHDNISSRGFNEVEKAIVIDRFLDTGYSRDRLISEVFPLLGIPRRKDFADKYLSLIRLDNEIRKSIATGRLELEKAFMFILLDNAETVFVNRILNRETITNINEAKEIIRNLLDLKEIKQTGIIELLSSVEISRVLSDIKSNKRQKGERICRIIRSMRYPVISRKEHEFDRSCRELGMDNDVRINHSRYFEGDEIRITIKASDEEKLRVNIEKLLANIKKGRFKEIFSIFK